MRTEHERAIGRLFSRLSARTLLACLVVVVVCALLLGSVRGLLGSEPPNLLLVTVDPRTPDHLGAWGYGRDTSPAIDALARESVVFEYARSHASWTLASIASLMTSEYSSAHGCWKYNSRLDPAFTTLAEQLADA